MDQKTALNILKTGANVFLTGSAGVGKSYTLKLYLDYLKARNVPYAITASTGIAATNIDGQTIHSWAGIGIKSYINQLHIDKIKKNQSKYMQIIKTRVLIIDEISMLHKDQFEAIDLVLRKLRQNEKPFGGLQVILAGDGLQLPPVSTNGEPNKDKFCFMSPVWIKANFKSCYLTKQYRQADGDKLNDILNAIRAQTVTQEHVDIIAATSSNVLSTPLKLYTHNKDVTAINKQHFNALPGVVYTNKAKTTGKSIFVDMLKANIKAPEVLELKVNAKVMFVKNDNINGQYANGSQGTVIGFERINGQFYPKVKLTSGLTLTAEPVDWKFEGNGAGTKATYTQVPLTLAYAITTHKCQGLSLDEAEIDLSKVFEKGQGYVAISRLKTLKGLKVIGLNNLAFSLDPLLIKIDKRLQELSAELEIEYAEERPDLHAAFLLTKYLTKMYR